MIYRSGTNAQPAAANFQKIPASELAKGGDAILYYNPGPTVYRFINPATIETLIRSWIKLKNVQPGATEIVTVTGVYIDDANGETYVRVFIEKNGNPAVLEAGINPYAVIAIIGGLFAAAGVSLYLLGTYGPKPIADAANAAIEAIAAAGKEVAKGAGFGIVVVIGIALVVLIVVNRLSKATA